MVNVLVTPSNPQPFGTNQQHRTQTQYHFHQCRHHANSKGLATGFFHVLDGNGQTDAGEANGEEPFVDGVHGPEWRSFNSGAAEGGDIQTVQENQ